MTLSFKPIIALDFLNIKIENLEAWLTKSDLISSSITKSYLLQTVTESLTLENPVEFIFMVNNFIFGVSYKNDIQKIIFFDEVKQDFELMESIPLTSLELYRSAILDWIFNYKKENSLLSQNIHKLQKCKDDKMYRFPEFTTCISVLDARDLGFKLNNFFVPISKEFKKIYQFFGTKYKTNNILDCVNLTKVYFLDKWILGFSFQMENHTEEHFFWNIFLEDKLLLMDKFTFDAPIHYNVNSLLDKINANGIDSLNANEIEFLKINK